MKTDVISKFILFPFMTMTLSYGSPLLSYFISDHLLLGGIINPPFLYECAVYNISFCDRPGIEYEFVKSIAEMLNFTFDLIETQWDANSTNGTGSMEQLILDLETGAVNMSLSFLTITPGRNLEYSQPIMYYRKAFLIQTPSSQKIEFLLTLPFGRYFWLSLMLIIPVFFVSLTFMSMLMRDGGKSSSLSHNAWTIIGSTVKPVIVHRTVPHAGNRWLLLTWQIGKTIILSLYSASLVGFLFSKQDPTMPFTALSGLVASLETQQFHVVKVRGEESILESISNNSIRERIEKVLEESPIRTLDSTETAVKYVAKTKGAVFGGFNTNLEIWSQIYNVCDVTVIEDKEVDVHLMALAFPKNFAYAEQIKRITSEVATSNFMSRLEKKYVRQDKGLGCEKDRNQGGTKQLLPLSIVQMQGSFWVLFGGGILGSLSVLYEYFRRRKIDRYERRIRKL